MIRIEKLSGLGLGFAVGAMFMSGAQAAGSETVVIERENIEWGQSDSQESQDSLAEEVLELIKTPGNALSDAAKAHNAKESVNCAGDDRFLEHLYIPLEKDTPQVITLDSLENYVTSHTSYDEEGLPSKDFSMGTSYTRYIVLKPYGGRIKANGAALACRPFVVQVDSMVTEGYADTPKSETPDRATLKSGKLKFEQ